MINTLTQSLRVNNYRNGVGVNPGDYIQQFNVAGNPNRMTHRAVWLLPYYNAVLPGPSTLFETLEERLFPARLVIFWSRIITHEIDEDAGPMPDQFMWGSGAGDDTSQGIGFPLPIISPPNVHTHLLHTLMGTLRVHKTNSNSWGG